MVAACVECNLSKGAQELADAVTVTIAGPTLLDHLDNLAKEYECDMADAVAVVIGIEGDKLYDRFIAEANLLALPTGESVH